MFKDEGITVYKRLRQPLRQTEAENNLTLNTVFGLIMLGGGSVFQSSYSLPCSSLGCTLVFPSTIECQVFNGQSYGMSLDYGTQPALDLALN